MNQEDQQNNGAAPAQAYDPDEALSMSMIAKRLGVNHETARRMAMSGEFKAWQNKDGGHWRARRGDIDEFIRTRQNQSQAGQAEGADQ
jgi:excisionase family DNA binding protein